jgi:hypothetical protein
MKSKKVLEAIKWYEGLEDDKRMKLQKDFGNNGIADRETKFYKWLVEKRIEDYCENLLNKFKKDPQYDLKQEFGMMLMRHIDSFTIEERKRYDELEELLKNSY